jgi:hypothetical protein
MVVDDRVYAREALETYLYYSELSRGAALDFRGAAMTRSLDWRDANDSGDSGLIECRDPPKFFAKCFGRAYLSIRARCIWLDRN